MANMGTSQSEEMATDVRGKLIAYKKDINQAYLNADDALSIGLTVKIGPGMEADSFELETSIKFIADQVKDKSKRIIGGKQFMPA